LLPWTEPSDSSLPKVPSSLNTPVTVSELVEIDKLLSGNVIEFKDPLEYCYIRHTVKINANVAEATHGETRVEILGAGNGSAVFQKFRLKQKPLTYVSATTASGTESTLQIRVNDILWKEADTFYGRGPSERIYVVTFEDDGSVYVQFGNGITGARLPSGQDNIRATYRVGTGMEGLLDDKQLSLLLSPRLGLKSVLNPLPSSGAEDPEAPENIRANAPQTVLGLDRIVSILDYQFFANAFAGIGKARADLLWKGESRTLHLTVASAAGGEVDKDLKEKLGIAIDQARHDLYPVVIQSFTEILFNLIASVKVHPDYLVDKVFEQIRAALLAEYSFENRQFGQNVSPSEVIALMQDVEGVLAVDLDILGKKDPVVQSFFILPAKTAVWSGTGNDIEPAQLLLIDSDNITLKEWSNEN
jgi:predicted phage baseplate assembly protein